MRCFISHNYKNKDSAGNKAKTDIEEIMLGMGFKNIGLPQTSHGNTLAHFLLNLAGVAKASFSLKKGDVLVLQYPLKKYYTCLCKMAHACGARTVTIIHDLGSFRSKHLSVKQEIKRLNNTDYIIAHNESMKKWLVDNGIKTPVGTLGIFDYLSATEAPDHAACIKHDHPVVLYAGSMHPDKITFFKHLVPHLDKLKFNVYGSGFNPKSINGEGKFIPMGFIKSEELIRTGEGDFGLVWDGLNIDCCSGRLGEYLRYNNPHKASLYLRCNLPLIVWDLSLIHI